jgi:hypothetical protein
MPLSCVELTTFDYAKYVSACMSLSTFWYIWKPDGKSFRVVRYFPLSQSSDDRMKLAAVLTWADLTDPGSVIRLTNMKREWFETVQTDSDATEIEIDISKFRYVA